VTSAGPGVLLNLRPQSDQPWRVGSEPLVEIGAAPEFPAGSASATGSTSAVRLTDGRIAVYSPRSKQIGYFTASGEFIRSVVSLSAGLGSLIPLRGDSLAVFNPRTRTVTVFDEDGTFASTTQIQSPADVVGEVHLVARLDDGSFLALIHEIPDEGTARESGSVWHLGATGAPVARISGCQGHLLGLRGLIPFGSSDPYPVWNGSAVILGETASYRFHAVPLDGSPERIFARQVSLEPVTEEDLSEYRSWFSERTGSRTSRELVEQMLADPNAPGTHPALGPVLVDRGGNLWVANHESRPDGRLKLPGRPLPRDAYRLWSVFAPGGEWVTDVEMPDGLVVRDIGDDYVLGVVAREGDVAQVEMYALAK